MSCVFGEGRTGGWAESAPSLIVAMTGFFAILAGGVINVFTVPAYKESLDWYLDECRQQGIAPAWQTRLILAVSDFVVHHGFLSVLVVAVFFTAMVLFVRGVSWRLGMTLAVLLLIFLGAYPVILLQGLFQEIVTL